MDITILLVLLGVGLLAGLSGGGADGGTEPPDPDDNTDDTVTVVSGEKAFGGGGNDMLTAPGLVDRSTVFGGAGNDSITLDATNSDIGGGVGDDIITLSGAFNTIFGGEGNDTLRGGPGTTDSAMFGGYGADRFELEHVTGPAFASSYFGGNGRDLFQADLLLDGTGGAAPVLDGGNDADRFELNLAAAALRPAGATPATTMVRIDGFEVGEDTLRIDGNGATVRLVTAANGDDADIILTFAGTDTTPARQGIIRLTDAEGLDMDDLILAPGTLPEPIPEPQPITLAANQTIEGSAGNDVVTSGPNVTRSTVYGLDGDDQMDVTADYSQLSGGNGNDDIALAGYHSTIFGGAGNDTLTSSTASIYNRLFGGDGNDTLNLDYSTHAGQERPASDGGDGADRFNVDLTLTIDPDRAPEAPELEGGEGADLFALDLQLGNVVVPDSDTDLTRQVLTIEDFVVGRDILQIDAAGATVSLAQDGRGRFTDVVLTYPAANGDPAVSALVRLENVTGLTLADIVLNPA